MAMKTRVREVACGLALTMLACTSSAGVTPASEGSDPIDWNAALECDTTSCAARELCIRWQGVADGPPTMSSCHHVPDDCVSSPSCDCIKALVLECSSKCRSEGDRRFTCGEGI
jgi:hypothetical protein